MIQSFITGIDISHQHIRAVVIKPIKNTCKLVRCYQMPLDNHILTDNDRLNYQKIVKKLEELRKALPLFSRKVCLSIPDNMLITKQLQLDSDLNQEECQFVIKQTLSKHSVIEIDELYFDFEVLPSESQNHTASRYQVYAARKHDIDGLMSACSRAGLTSLLINPYSSNLIQLLRYALHHYRDKNWLLIGLNGSCLAMCFESKQHGSVYHQVEVGKEISAISDGLRSLFLHIQLLKITPKGIWLTGEASLDSVQVMKSLSEATFPCIDLPLVKLAKCQNQLSLPRECFHAFGLALSGANWLGYFDGI
ncbi:pilus assembly protein PilM [Vibrio zhanjiangensis]|uniref:Pilus assembly protein PilM n=1 Tax=Vibrio zhanjiangensis TaxID=1046128 RepID=A0ABQ6EYV7_9VIBR|nr:pilus assembly protein PilM [Vibrio zhanjiangensis]GLT17891.1 pilus assembly protein PilM [Vibrio zhanjiangensis]